MSAPVDLATGTAGRPQRVGLATDLVLADEVSGEKVELDDVVSIGIDVVAN